MRAALRGMLLAFACLVLVVAPAAAAAPSITAPSAAVIETSTGTVVFSKNGEQRRGMASTTKLMTALVALDEKPLSTVFSAVDYGGSPVETRINLAPGEKMTLADLVRAMMLPSANDAAETVAVRTAGTKAKFVGQMNAKAKEMGLSDTHFTNPVGLDAPTHKTSAEDLARIGAAAHENPFLRATVKRQRITLASGAVSRTLINRNGVLGEKLPGGGVIDGMKTGHTTSAGYSLVGSATRGGVTMVSVVLGEPSEAARDADTEKLLRWSSQLFQNRQVVRAKQQVTTVPVLHGKVETVDAVVPEAVRRIVPRGAETTLKPVSMSPGIDTPAKAGTAVGTAQVLVNDELVETVPLVTRVAVERQGSVAALVEGIGDHWKGTLIALLLVLGGSLTIVRALRSGRRPTTTRPAASAPGEPSERTSAP